MPKKYTSYTVKGTKVPGVTTILSVLDKGEGFLRWVASRGFENSKKEARKAAEFGDLVHTGIDSWINNLPVLGSLEVKNAVDSFKKWSTKNVERWLALEVGIFSSKYLYAGTADAFAVLKSGRIALIDFKTSKAIRAEYILQLNAYANGDYTDNGFDLKTIDEALIVHYNRKTGEWDTHPILLADEHFRAFISLRYLYKWREENQVLY